MTKREFLDTVFALVPNEANKIMDAFDEYVESNVAPTGRSGKERRMTKYIIEIPDDVQYVLFNGKADNKYYTAVRPVAELEELNSDYINEHYGELQDEAYQAGLDKAWELANDVLYDRGNILDILGCDTSTRALDGFTPREIIEKLEAYEKSDRIEVGDEVKWNSDVIVITRVYEDGGFNWCDGISQDGRAFHVLAENVRKTGKHYDIASILEAMRK